MLKPLKSKVEEKYQELYETVGSVIDKWGNSRDNLIAILLNVQSKSSRNFVSKEAMLVVSEIMGISAQEVYEVATFYHAIATEPRGRFLVQLCQGTSCTVNKAVNVKDALEAEIGIKIGSTTPDGMFTFEYTPCFGACDVSPAMRLNGKVVGNLTQEKIKQIIIECREVAENE
ncbi:NADH dehydrogenase (ubiquinone) 24 kDa subunit (plasmid) [Peptoclostridium acidaminophilum DSM 3953]|uniref:NADH dehydrogenase (Ubiquinone) 24 kDa subunit n=1 Tax=Peptoclostridium acidaminophilum DSM 3953 TaxID=1286171 RepID=W8TA48_PEPAC|nr:NAD(P)H-dependent oxidoreductase subunit E [Peptoclostridium acidaminophilum]AHM57770.1 NADH dehydrogenase (ubiquinone) 24 kDa subunit [Peptoclostridium acidaminophilum DSM 3953]